MVDLIPVFDNDLRELITKVESEIDHPLAFRQYSLYTTTIFFPFCPNYVGNFFYPQTTTWKIAERLFLKYLVVQLNRYTPHF